MFLTILLQKSVQSPPRKIKQEPWIMFRLLKSLVPFRKHYKKLLLDTVTEEHINTY